MIAQVRMRPAAVIANPTSEVISLAWSVEPPQPPSRKHCGCPVHSGKFAGDC